MNLWSWIFFPRSKVFERSGHRLLSAGQVPCGRLRAICVFCARRVRDLYQLCAICLFVRDLFIRARSVSVVRDLFIHARSIYSCVICVSFCASRAHNVFVGPGFKPLTIQHDLFTGPRFDSWDWLPVSGQ